VRKTIYGWGWGNKGKGQKSSTPGEQANFLKAKYLLPLFPRRLNENENELGTRFHGARLENCRSRLAALAKK